MIRGRNKESSHNWSNRGSFLSKPRQGWLHPDTQLSPDVGICYGVRVCVVIWLFWRLVVNVNLINNYIYLNCAAKIYCKLKIAEVYKYISS